MKRPVYLIACSYIFMLILASFLNNTANIIMFVLLLIVLCILSLVFNFKNNKKIILIIASFTVALASYQLQTNLAYNNVVSLDGESANIKAVVINKVESQGKMDYIIETKDFRADGVPKKIKLLFYTEDNIELDYYDEIEVLVDFKNYNKGKSLIYDQNKTKEIYLSAIQDSGSKMIVNKDVDKPIYYYLLSFKDNIKENIDKHIKNSLNRSILKGILFGETSNIPRETYNKFKDVGIIHIFAVSGFHLAMLTLIFYKFLSILKLNKKLSYMIICVFILVFIGISGFSNSILRSGIMMLIFYTSKLFGERVDSLNSLSVASLAILFFNPYAVGNISFILTFCATFGIIFYNMKIIPILHKKYTYKSKILFYILKSMTCTATVVIFILPASIIFFKTISIISPISNLIIVPFIYLILPLGFLVGIFGSIGILAHVFSFLSKIINFLISIVVYIVEIISKMPFNTLPLGFDFIFIWVSVSMVLLFFGYISRKKSKFMLVSGFLSIILLIIGTISHILFTKDLLEINIIVEGYGKSAVISHNSFTVVVGCGGSDYISTSVINYLNSIGTNNIDILILPNLAKTTARAAPSLISGYKVDSIVMPNKGVMYNSILDSVDESANLILLDNLEIDLGGNIKLAIDNNFSSPIIRFEFFEFDVKIGWSGKSMIESFDGQDSNIGVVFDSNYELFDKIGSDIIVLGNDIQKSVISSKELIKAYDNRYNKIFVDKYGSIRIRSIK